MDGFVRAVQGFEEDYKRQKIKYLEGMLWDCFMDFPPTDLTTTLRMEDFLVSYDSEVSKIKNKMLSYINERKKFHPSNRKLLNSGDLAEVSSFFKEVQKKIQSITVSKDSIDNIKNRLSAYIGRIEQFKSANDDINYGADFWFWQKSRAINRKVNYLIALELVDYLNKKSPNFDIFKQISIIRRGIVIQHLKEEEQQLVREHR